MKSIIISFLLLFSISVLFADTEDDLYQFEYLCSEITDYTIDDNCDSTMSLSIKALEIGYAQKLYQQLVSPVANRAVCLIRNGFREEAKGELNKLLAFKGNLTEVQQGILLAKRANVYYLLNQIDSAKSDLKFAKNVLRNSDFPLIAGDASMFLAELYDEIGVGYKSVAEYLDAANIFYKERDTIYGDRCTLSAAHWLFKSELKNEAFEIVRPIIQRVKGKERLLKLVGIYHFYKDDVQTSELKMKEILQLLEQYENELNIEDRNIVYHTVIWYYLLKDDYKSALPYLSFFLNNSDISNYREYRSDYYLTKLLACIVNNEVENAKKVKVNLDNHFQGNKSIQKYEIDLEYYALIGDFKKRIETYNEYLEYRKNYNRDKQVNKMAYLHAQFESEKKEQEIKLQEAEIEILKEKDTNKTRLIWFSIFSGLVLGIFLILRVRMYRLQKNVLQNKNKLVESEKRYLNTQLETKEKELTDFAQHLSQKNEILEELKEKVQIGLDKELHKEEILSLFSQDRIQEENWKDLQSRFSKVHASFFDKLKQKYPQLSVGDEKLCVLIKLGMSSKEIANILLISPKSIDQKKYRLKKKIDADSALSISELLMNL